MAVLEQVLPILRITVCIVVGLLGFVFAGYANELVKPVITDVDRVILIGGYIVGVGSVVLWLAKRKFWAGRVAADEI